MNMTIAKTTDIRCEHMHIYMTNIFPNLFAKVFSFTFHSIYGICMWQETIRFHFLFLFLIAYYLCIRNDVVDDILKHLFVSGMYKNL